MTKLSRFSKKLGKDVPFYTQTLNFSGDDITLAENFAFLYGDDILVKFVKSAMQKAVDKKEFLEFTIFDDVDDFVCSRSILTQKR